MTTPDRALRRGIFLGGVIVFGAGIVGEALHWFITTAIHPRASTGRHIAVAVEGLIGILILLWGIVTARREARALKLAASMRESSRDLGP